jgi:hypothetical protein
MSLFPDYATLEPQWRADCNNWNISITTINRRLLALSSPPIFLRLFNDRYAKETQEEIVAVAPGFIDLSVD